MVIRKTREFFQSANEFQEAQENYFTTLHQTTKLEGRLWNDPDYEKGIKQSAIVSHEDYPFAKEALEKTEAKLKELEQKLDDTLTDIQNQINQKAKAETAKEVINLLHETIQHLKEEIQTKLIAVQDSLEAKKSSLDYFTIAFMGKTKAGKSTLHSILTEQGWDAIGAGKQRTTRLNRVYEWKNIRIIDTPGIGAPGGKTDEEIAQSIINKADLVVFIVTNDSQQESEFQFLKLLKENAKPLCILLNVFKNLSNSRRGEYELKRFLENPERLFNDQEMKGHFNRIRGYAEKYYGNDYFAIVPVMLLAAQLSYQDKYENHKEQLWEASQIEKFLDQIRLSVVEQGTIRRSQNLLGSTVKVIEEADTWAKEQATPYHTLAEEIQHKQEKLEQDIDKAIKETDEALKIEMKALFQEIKDKIPDFAEDHWKDSKEQQSRAWEKQVKEIKLEERLKNNAEEKWNDFINKVKQLLEELGKDLQFTAEFGGIPGFDFDDQDTFDFKGFFNIVGGLLGVAGAIAFLFAGGFIPGIVMTVTGVVMGLVANLFKSKAEIKKEAVEKISKSLLQQIDKYEEEQTNQVTADFRKNCNQVKAEVKTYLHQLVAGLETISQQLKTSQSNLDQQVNFLNCAYGKRIIDWSQKHYEPLTQDAINREVASVTRDIGKSITIEAKKNVSITRTQEELDSILQEKVVIRLREISWNYLVHPKQLPREEEKIMNTHHHHDSEFEVNEISQRFQSHLKQFEKFLSSQEDEQLKAIHEKLRQDLDNYYKNGILTIALIGQYSAGKSTIISALTGRRDIYIDADIATDTTTLYDWNGIKIIDTPGLYTDRTNHDQKTYDAIEKADLLVFCLTSKLFDNITADNFKKLAYDQEYSGKMMLVINKMSQASGEEEELIANYKESLAKALEPYSLESFPLSFIDAKDYCEGIDEEDDLLIKLSGFSEFIQQLNQFIEEKKIISRLDTPVRITLSKLNDAELAIQRDDNEDAAYLELVNRCARIVEEQRKIFQTKIKKIALELYSKVRKEATPLLEGLGKIKDQEKWEELANKTDNNIQQHCNSAQKQLEEIANQAQVDLMESLQEVLTSDFAQLLIKRLEKEDKVSAHKFSNQFNNSGQKQKLKNLLQLSDFVGDKLFKSAKNSIPLFGKSGFLKSWNVVGSDMHKGVYEIGKFLGVNFKPLEAVKWAKNLGNAAKFAGPVASIISLGMDINESQEEEKRSEELSKERQKINGQITELAQQLQTQLESIGREVETQLYDEAVAKIEEMREAHHQTISQNQEQMQQLNTLRQEFKQILSDIDRGLSQT